MCMSGYVEVSLYGSSTHELNDDGFSLFKKDSLNVKNVHDV
jgi:hypothetical protein